MKMEQSVPERRHINFRPRGITQKKTYNNSLYLLHPNRANSNKHIFTNFKIILNFTKTKLETVLQQNTVIYEHRIYMKEWVLCGYVITHNGNCQV